ncbi:MAG: solute:Na+ symporter, SSS family [Candidatus Argoarchaeum ethanivorans]|uniref:Solute:Na+ symporter, SSS family n=1 Tax=Candidatus Argoarchaeum ethanivorans TaxID=2608793 RepID=A0A8B3S0X7_9EURY|nr:MAG: solute:Na+ symporter, SSS family [Candidatus Argoarchaeum ethanivorans]
MAALSGVNLFFALLAGYIILLVLIGFASYKRQHSMVDFWLAGRSLSAFNIGLSAAASWLTAGALLFVSGLFVLIGIGSIWIFVVPNILALLLIAAISKKIKNTPALTQPELLEIRYNSKIRAPVALIITATMVLFSVSDFKGFQYVLGVFYGIPPYHAVLIMASVISVYILLGGFRAVIWTDSIQFIFLALTAVSVGVIALYLPLEPANINDAVNRAGTLLNGMDSTWYNPFFLGGVSGALILMLALLPGWMVEQDPWQRVLAARDIKSARRGMILGAFLLALVFAACLAAAIGLRNIYAIPASVPEAEQLYLQFILDHFSPVVIALFAAGFAAASMSCTDTFTTSGASCLSRDIYQRHLYPGATEYHMQWINRLLIVLLIAIAAVVSLYVESILEAVIIATVIATSSYFFPIMGGLFWKRANSCGALSALIIGGGSQIALIAYEFTHQIRLEQIHPLLTEHGVLVGLGLSAVSFISISLVTQPPPQQNTQPFFFSEATSKTQTEPVEPQAILLDIKRQITGERAHLTLTIPSPQNLDWKQFTQTLQKINPRWTTPAGSNTIYRQIHHDLLTCINITRGTDTQIWLTSEPSVRQMQELENEIYQAHEEIIEAIDMRVEF